MILKSSILVETRLHEQLRQSREWKVKQTVSVLIMYRLASQHRCFAHGFESAKCWRVT